MLSRSYGLLLQSERLLPGLEPIRGEGSPDVIVHLLEEAPLPDRPDIGVLHATSDTFDAEGRPILVVHCSNDRQHYIFEYSDGTRFLIGDRGAHIWAHWPLPLTIEDTATYLLGPVLGFVLRLRHRVCLHSSSVVIGDAAVAFTGASGAGKSTLAASLVGKGYRALSEDVLPLRWVDGQVWADAGPPVIRLWQSSVKSLFGAPDAMPFMTPNWTKRFQQLSAASGSFLPDGRPLRVIYLLMREAGRTATDIRALSAREALLELVSNTYSNQLLDAEMRAQEFFQLGQLVLTTPVRQLRFGDDFQLLPHVCSTIVADVENLEKTQVALA